MKKEKKKKMISDDYTRIPMDIEPPPTLCTVRGGETNGVKSPLRSEYDARGEREEEHPPLRSD